MQRMGKKAVEYIMELVAKGNLERHVIHQKLTAQLIVRQSTAPAHKSTQAAGPAKRVDKNPFLLYVTGTRA